LRRGGRKRSQSEGQAQNCQQQFSKFHLFPRMELKGFIASYPF
jgi:hypothetical protein